MLWSTEASCVFARHTEPALPWKSNSGTCEVHKKDVFRVVHIHQFLMAFTVALGHIQNSNEYQLKWRVSDGLQSGTGTLINIPTYQS